MPASLNSFLAALTFYTCLPISAQLTLDFSRIARWAPLVGLLLGLGLGAIDLGLEWLQMPILIRSGLIVALWIWWTGGLHLDGAMDAADGLAVQDPDRRLAVMADSVAGAYGAMAAVVIILLKTCAIAAITKDRSWALLFAAGWGRWGQVIAIAAYPYLKAQGKGSFHRAGLSIPGDLLLGFGFIFAAIGTQLYLHPHAWAQIAIRNAIGCLLALAIGYYFHRRFGGHTGDTYGAIVEWTEVAIVCVWTIPLAFS